jgi:DNA-binding NarL/FixJ family response regulator
MPPSSEAPRPLRVLVADDHALHRRALVRRLEREDGVEVVGEARDGDVALSLVRMLRPDVTVTDVRMPGMSGFDLARVIRCDRDLRDTRVIVLTAFADEATRVRARTAGAVACVAKSEGLDGVCAGLR